MGGAETMIVAGIGCRKGCAADEILAVLRRAEALAEPADALAAPAFKHGEPGLHEAAARTGLPLLFIGDDALAAAQPHCVTRSAAAARATGFASIAEAAAIGRGGTLLLPRLAGTHATCALAVHPSMPVR